MCNNINNKNSNAIITQQFCKVKVEIIGNHHIDLLYFLFIFNKSQSMNYLKRKNDEFPMGTHIITPFAYLATP